MATAKCTFILTFLMCVEMTHVSVRTRLMSDKLNGYNTGVPPTTHNNLPVDLQIGFGLFSIVDINEKEQSLSTNSWINSEWTDSRLAWNQSVYNVTDVYYKQSTIWVPDLAIVNTLKERKHPGHVDVLCHVKADGRVSWMPGDIFITTCELDVTYFPFDTQICKIIITSWMLAEYEIKLTPITASHTPENTYDTVYIPDQATNSLWDITNVTLRSDDKEYYTAGAVDIIVSLKRCPSFYMINDILPLICISVLVCLVFALPMDKGDRVSFSMSILLSLVVFLTLLGDHLPKTSRQTSLLTIYLTALLIISTLCVFLTVLTQRVSTFCNSKEIPLWIRSVLRAREGKKGMKIECGGSTKINDDLFKNVNTDTAQMDTDKTDSDVNGIIWANVAEYLDHVFMVVFFLAIILTNLTYFSVVVILTGWPHPC